MDLLYVIPPLVGFGVNMVLAVLVLWQRPHSFLHRIFSLFLISMGVWAFTILGMRATLSLEQALVWEKAIFAILPLVSVSFYHFVLLFTRAKKTGWRLLLAYLCLVFFVSLAPTDLLVVRMKEMWYGHGFVGGPFLFSYIATFYGIVALALFRIVRAYRASESAVERDRYIYVAAGAAACILGLLIDVIAAQGVPIYPMGIPGNILFSALTTLAMLKYQLLDIQVVVRKGTAYVIVTATGMGLYIGILLLVYFFVSHALGAPPWVDMAFVIAVAIGLQPMLRWVQNRVDRWFYRDRYDYLRALESLGNQPKAITALAFMAESLVNMAASALRCKSASVLLPDVEGKYSISASSKGTAVQGPLCLDHDSALVRWLSQREDFLTREDLSIMPQLQALTAREREMLHRLEAELFVPLVTREGLRGILILARKLSEQDYSAEELRMLRVVARQMATTLDNTRLYELQRRRYREQALLAKLGMTISSELDLNKVFHLFIYELKEVSPIDYASMTLVEEGEESSAIAFVVTTFTSAQPSQATEQGAAMARGATAPVPVNGGEPWTDERLLEAGIRSVVRLPLNFKGRDVGTFVLGAREAEAYSGDTLKLLQQVANQLAIAAESYRLYIAEKKARLEVEDLYKERLEFINALIHEIKTPLTAMRASSELLREELLNDSSAIHALAENLDISSHNLDRRVSELVHFVKLQSTELALQPQPVDIRQLAQHAAAQVSALLQNRNQTLKLDLPDTLPRIEADPDRVVQILLNLLTNASKFGPPHSQISLRARATDSSVTIEVRDCAPPIGPEEAEAIFKPYYKGKKARSGGLGLGLSICKRLAQLHGGRIWVEAQTTGNCFKFSLPLARTPGVGHKSVAHCR